MISTKTAKVIEYSPNTVRRAQRALACAPLCLGLFQAMGKDSIPLLTMADEPGFKAGYTPKPTSEAKVESELMWLIKVGLLRREVDGQGITDSFRLTPLGKQIVSKWEGMGDSFTCVSFVDRVVNFFLRLFN